MTEIKKTEMSRKFFLENDRYQMTIEVMRGKNGEKRFSIVGTNRDKEFVFVRSKGDVVKAIGELLVEASKL